MAFDAFALILTMLALGMVFARLRVFPDNAADVLNRVVLYVCLPAAVLTYVPRLHVDASLLGVVVTPWVLTAATIALVALATRLFGFRRDEHAVLLLCVALCNSSFIGYPMVRALLGEHALPYAVVYDQFGTFVLLSTFGLYVLARYGGDAPPTAREMGLRILKFPPVWALLVGLTLMPEQPPAWIGGALQKLADGSLLGDNTDGAGLVRDLTVNAGVELRGRRILLLGHGCLWLLRLIAGGDFPGWSLLLAPVIEAVLWPFISLLLLAPQRLAPDRDLTRPL